MHMLYLVIQHFFLLSLLSFKFTSVNSGTNQKSMTYNNSKKTPTIICIFFCCITDACSIANKIFPLIGLTLFQEIAIHITQFSLNCHCNSS